MPWRCPATPSCSRRRSSRTSTTTAPRSAVRAEERLAAKHELGEDRPTEDELADYVAHLEATFDPRTCASCNLFSLLPLRAARLQQIPWHLLIEIGIAPLRRGRPRRAGRRHRRGRRAPLPEAHVAQVTATVTGLPQWTGRLRADPVGLPGTINVVLVKSDAAALGVHGIAVQRIGADGPETWARGLRRPAVAGHPPLAS